MWKQKISMSVGNEYEIPTPALVSILKQIGFDGISPEWEEGVDLAPVIAAAKECGMALPSMHSPIGKVSYMWSADPALSAPALEELLRSLEDCRRYDIPVMVVHVWFEFAKLYADKTIPCGLENYGKLVKKAAEYGIQIAFENTEGEEFLAALMDHFKGDDTVGFCWDSGHEMCYNHSEDLLARYGDRLLVTHLNDNLGISRFDGEIYWTDDLHLLPYDGIADWDDNIARLKRSRPLAFLNFELCKGSKPNRHDNDKYAAMDYTAYFTEAYARACRIAARYAK